MRNYSFHKGKTNSSIQNSVNCSAVFLSSLISIMPAHHLTFYENQKLEKNYTLLKTNVPGLFMSWSNGPN